MAAAALTPIPRFTHWPPPCPTWLRAASAYSQVREAARRRKPVRTHNRPINRVAGFGLAVLTGPGMDFGAGGYTPLPFEPGAQLVCVHEGAAKVRETLPKVLDAEWSENWKLSFLGRTLFEGPRFVAYRQMFLNHIVHHRSQLGV